MKSKNIFAILLILISVAWISQALPFEKPTHGAINANIAQRTINQFSLNDYLIKQLGFKEGTQQVLSIGSNKKTVFQWIAEGGIKEDEPEQNWRLVAGKARNNNHYHNPLGGLWEYSGLDANLVFHYTGRSSILWAQNSNQDPGGKWSWHDARMYFYTALTGRDFYGNVIAPTQKDRERYFADTFRAVGQVMHLIQDASVPAHGRNEIHKPFHYEPWLEKIRKNEGGRFNGFIANPITFDSSILNLVPLDLSAPVPIANLVDTDKYGGNNPDITATPAIGIAEYANANFFGESTIFSNAFPYPARSSVETEDREIPDPRGVKPTVMRKYYIKKRDGERGKDPEKGYRMAPVDFLYKYITTYFPIYTYLAKPALDGGVYNDYASLLLPRAVGYSAGLLQYFFRGKLQVTSLPILYKNSIYIMRVKIKNITPTQETMKNGWFTLSYHYTPTGKPSDGSEDIFGQTSVCSSEQPCKELKFQEEMTIDFILPEFIPKENYNSAKFTLAIRGTLGNEEGTVIGKYFTPGEIKFNEEWDNGLNGNHTWAHLDFDTSQAYPGHGQTSNTIEGDTLIKENIRYAGYKNPSANGSFVGIDPVYSGFKDILPILITPNTYLEFKIDKMSINQIPPSPLGTTAHYQGLWLFFNHGLVLQLSQDDQFVYYNPTTTAMWTFDLGMIFVSNIYGMFQDASITIPPGDLYLEKIKFIQQLFELGEPSTVEHHQHMEVDFIRIIEEKQQEEQQQ